MSSRRLSAVPAPRRRAGLYVRVSALMGRTGEDFLSPSIQIDTMTAAAERDGDLVVEVWEDIDRTGRTMLKRTGLADAMDAARDGRIDVLYVYDLSRWARNVAEGLTELAAIEKAGVPVVSATERVDRSTTSGRLTAGLLLLLAEHYSDLIGDRWRDVHRQNLERGVHHGVPPFGYVRAGKREIVPDPVLGPMVAELFIRHGSGESIASLARWGTRRLGRRFDPAQVSRMLRNPTYLGLVHLGGEVLPGRHEPLVEVDTFGQVQRHLKHAARLPSRSKQSVHSLAGLVKCDRCGGSMHKRNRDRGGTTPNDPFYFCRAAYVDRSLCPGVGTPSTSQIERLVLVELERRVNDVPDGSAAHAAAEDARRARAASDRRTLKEEIARNEKAVATLAVKLATHVLSDMAYRVAVAQLEETLTGLRAQVEELADEDDGMTFEESRSLAAALLELWPSMTSQEQAEAMRTHVREVRVLPLPKGKRLGRKVHVVWR